MYLRHTSEELNQIFKQRPYQGQSPELARIIFLGLDANFAGDIESDRAKFSQLKDYLQDGVKFWEKNKYHHPFISYKKYYEDGVPYHKRFAKLKLDETYARHISFVELLDIPTMGQTTSNKSEFYNLLNYEYLNKLERVISNPENKKVIFLSRSVWKALACIKKKFGLFQWLPDKQVKGINQVHKMYEDNAVCIYQVTHFSAAISTEHINEIRQNIDEFLVPTVENIDERRGQYNNSLQLALALCIKIIEELSNETDLRIYTWLKDPGNYYITLYPAEFMEVYEQNDLGNATEEVKRRIFSIIDLPSAEDILGTTIGLYSKDCLMIPG